MSKVKMKKLKYFNGEPGEKKKGWFNFLTGSHDWMLFESTDKRMHELIRSGLPKYVAIDSFAFLPGWDGKWSTVISMQFNGFTSGFFSPSKSTIAAETGLSRQTINKHIKEYREHPQYKAETEQFRFMASKVPAKVFKFAVNGDVRAAKLYFEMVGAIGVQQSGTVINEQKNYIQINNTVLSQEILNKLNPEQLNQIEQIIKIAAPEDTKGQ